MWALCFKESLVAIWQIPIELVPNQWVEKRGLDTMALYDEEGYHSTSCAWANNQPTKDLNEVFDKILTKSDTSDDEVIYWGSDKKHDISAWFEGEIVVSIGFRIDLRESINELLISFVEVANKLDCMLFITGQHVLIKPNVFELKKYILKSNAAKFVQNPIEFLNELGDEQ